MPVHRLRPERRSARQRGAGRGARGRGEASLRRGRLHHRGPLLQAAEQHGHARRPRVVGERAAARRRRSSRTRRPPAGSRPTWPRRSPITRDTTYVVSYHSSLRLLRPQPRRAVPRACTVLRCTPLPTPSSAATASTGTGRVGSRTRPGTRRATGWTRSSTGHRRPTPARRGRLDHPGAGGHIGARVQPGERSASTSRLPRAASAAASLTLTDDRGRPSRRPSPTTPRPGPPRFRPPSRSGPG